MWLSKHLSTEIFASQQQKKKKGGGGWLQYPFLPQNQKLYLDNHERYDMEHPYLAQINFERETTNEDRAMTVWPILKVGRSLTH